MEKLTVIKVGGKIVEEEATLYKLLDDFAANARCDSRQVSPPSVNMLDVANVALLIQFAKYWRYLLMLSEASFLTMQKDLVNG